MRLAVDYRCVNSFTHDDSYPLPGLQSIFQRVGHSNLTLWQIVCLGVNDIMLS